MISKPRLTLREVRAPGNVKKELVFLLATDDVDLGDYIITDTTYGDDGKVSNKARHVYEFEPKVIKNGEWVALYTRAGEYQLDSTTGKNPVQVHRFFWGLGTSVWNKTGDKAYLLYAPRAERQALIVPESE